MQNIHLKPDTIDARSKEFAQARLEQSIFLNSVPKSGSHLLRNIMRMFVPVEQTYPDDFIQHATLPRHMRAFDDNPPKMSWGHLLFSDESVIATAKCRKILLVRDPYDWVLARARFLLSDEFSGPLDFLKTAPITADQFISMNIYGIHRKLPGLREIYTFNAAAWLGTDAYIMRYEELVAALRDLDGSRDYFSSLLDACGIALPDDWQERVRIGADRKNSGTARENLSIGGMELPERINDIQMQMVDLACPGLRALLGYEGH